MQTTELITPSAPESSPEDHGDVRRSASEPRTVGDALAETAPLTGVVAGFGPPVAFLAGPWLLFALALAGPFALVFTFVLVLVVAALVVALAGAVLASPYLLVRHLGRLRARHASVSSPAVRLVPAQTQRARA
jgi:hypothetical protein